MQVDAQVEQPTFAPVPYGNNQVDRVLNTDKQNGASPAAIRVSHPVAPVGAEVDGTDWTMIHDAYALVSFTRHVLIPAAVPAQATNDAASEPNSTRIIDASLPNCTDSMHASWARLLRTLDIKDGKLRAAVLKSRAFGGAFPNIWD